jgi:hypothetical protein
MHPGVDKWIEVEGDGVKHICNTNSTCYIE